MKFDKCMEYLYKVLCLLTVAAVVIGCITSCAMRPVTASAVEISAEEELQINDFLDAWAENQSAIDFQLSSDEDGNRNVRLKIYALQNLGLQNVSSIYDNLELSAAPDTMTVSGGGGVGYYRSHIDGNAHLVTVYSLPPFLPDYGTTTSLSYTLCSSDEFTVSARVSGSIQYCSSLPDTNYSAFGGYNLRRDPNNPDTSTFTLSATGDYFNFSSKTLSGSLSSYSYWNGYKCNLWNDSGAPLLSASAFSAVVNASSLPVNFAPTVGNGQGVQLPSGTIDTEKPWDYYNNILLPYLEEEFPGYDDYFVFPDGYQVPEPPYVPDYVDTNIPIIIPIIIGDPLPIDITDDLGNLLDVLDILAELLPDGGLQFNIDGVTITFPRDGDNVVIDGKQYPLPLPDLEIDGHTINLPDNTNFYFDDVHFVINADGTITIGGDTYTLPIGTPTQVTSDYVDRVYEYEIPTMERLNIVDAEIDPVDLSAYSSMISGFWGLGARLYADLDIVNVVIACLSISAIGYAISKIGGH